MGYIDGDLHCGTEKWSWKYNQDEAQSVSYSRSVRTTDISTVSIDSGLKRYGQLVYCNVSGAGLMYIWTKEEHSHRL